MNLTPSPTIMHKRLILSISFHFLRIFILDFLTKELHLFVIPLYCSRNFHKTAILNICFELALLFHLESLIYSNLFRFDWDMFIKNRWKYFC